MSNHDQQLLILRQDLNFITVKEIQDIIKGTNALLKSRHRISGGGRKNEIIDRYTNFLLSLIQNKRETVLNGIVNIVNQYAQSKFTWSYNSQEIVSSTSRYARPALWQQQTASSMSQVRFRMEPFFKSVAAIVAPKMIPASNSRNSSFFQFQLTPEQIQLLDTPLEQDEKPKYQIRFCCAAYSTHTHTLQQGLPLEFPNTCELKINETVIPNTTIRCIKGKPGTVHPADLSIGIRKTNQNVVELLYIQSGSPFVAAVYLVERKTISSFIEDMRKSQRLTKEKVLEKMKSVSEDADIVMESETISMKCPLAFTRIQTPCRSIHCAHLQCFDANTFLAMNEQTPTWSCPVCYKRIPEATDLAVDEYFLDILNKIPTSVESVKVEPDGNIVMEEKPEETLIDSSDDETDNGKETVKEEVAEGSMSHLLRKESQNQDVIIILDDDEDDNGNHNTTSNNATNNTNNNDSSNTNNNSNSNNNGSEGDEDEDEEDSENYSKTDSYNNGHSDGFTDNSDTNDSNKSDTTDDQTPPVQQETSNQSNKPNQTSHRDQVESQSAEKEKASQAQTQTNQQSQQQPPQPVVQDPLQIQLQQQIQQQLQQQQQQQMNNNHYPNGDGNHTIGNQFTTTMPPPLSNGFVFNPQVQAQQQQNGYPNQHNVFPNTLSSLPPPPPPFNKPSSSSSPSTVVPQKRAGDPINSLPPASKQKVNGNVIDLTLSSDDES